MSRFRLTTRMRFASLVAALLFVPVAEAATIQNIRAEFRNGQTFITWDNLPGSGWIYHVFSSSGPLVDSGSLAGAIEIAQVGDESAVDRRITSLLGQTVTYRIAEDQPPLPPTRGLFVNTTLVGALNYYAVTAERVDFGHDRTLVPGQNATVQPVWERAQKPVPVWQRTLVRPAGEDYVLWTSHLHTPLFPAMCNVPGRAYHVGLLRGAPGGALVLHGHGRGGSFLNSLVGTGMPGEWVMSIDDYIPTGDFSSFYFGYEVNYDLEQPYNFPRTEGGLVSDFTEERVLYLLDWAKESMPHDPNRVYAMGVSMGGSFAFFLGWHHPQRIAGTLAIVPKLCLGYRPDENLGLREALDRMWGSPDLDLPTTIGLRVFQWMDGREQARIKRHHGAAPIVGFCGLNDNSVGWEEKVAYFQAMEAYDAGGAWFWDERDHWTPHEQTDWFPMMGAQQLYKYRADRSFPAFSNASGNSDFGTGDPATADPIGSINGYLDWDENTVDDRSLNWEITLRTRAMATREGIIGAPAAATVDVTPRRTQRFIVAQGVTYRYEVRDAASGELLQSGTALADDDAVLTVRQVQVLDQGVRLKIYPSSTTGVTPGVTGRVQPHLALSRNPVRGEASLTIEWPTEGDGLVELYDMQGRRMRTEFAGAAEGFTERTFRTNGLAPGLYVLLARQGAAKTTRRVTVLE